MTLSCMSMDSHGMAWHSCMTLSWKQVDTLKSKSALEVIKGEISKLTGAKKHSLTVASIEPNATDSLQRFKRGRRAFGSKIEDRFVASSVSAISTAHCGAMQFLEGGDTYFTKWPVRLIPVADLKQMDELAYEKMYEFCWHLDLGLASLHIVMRCHDTYNHMQ